MTQLMKPITPNLAYQPVLLAIALMTMIISLAVFARALLIGTAQSRVQAALRHLAALEPAVTTEPVPIMPLIIVHTL